MIVDNISKRIYNWIYKLRIELMATVKKLLSLDESIARELENVATALHKTQKEVVENALDFYFDHTDSVVADSVTREIEAGTMQVHKSEDVYKELGIEI